MTVSVRKPYSTACRLICNGSVAKAPYNEMAVKDKKRHTKEMESYVVPEEYADAAPAAKTAKGKAAKAEKAPAKKAK